MFAFSSPVMIAGKDPLEYDSRHKKTRLPAGSCVSNLLRPCGANKQRAAGVCQTATVISFPQAESALDYQDDMALSEKEKKLLVKEIREAVDQSVKTAIEGALDRFEPHGWRRIMQFLREWSLVAAAIATPIALLAIAVTTGGIALTQHSQATSRLADEKQFEQKTSDRLDVLEARLREQQAVQSPARVLKEISTLQAPELALNLPALRKVSEQPVANVLPTPATLEKVAYQLKSVDQNTEDYWPTVLRFIQFASAQLASNAPPHGSKPVYVFKNIGANGLSLAPPRSVLEFDGGNLENMTITDSRVIFTNTPVTMKNVRFVNCAFEFPETGDLSPSTKRTGAFLLASGLTSVYFPSA